MENNHSQALRGLAFLVAHVLALAAIAYMASAVGTQWDRKIQSDGNHMRLIPLPAQTPVPANPSPTVSP